MNNTIENLYKKGSNESTPPTLDNLILNAAKQSCEEKPLPKKKAKRWLFALPVAAVVVMSFSMMLNYQNRQTEMMVQPTIQHDLKVDSRSKLKKSAQKFTVNKNMHQLDKDSLPLEPHRQATTTLSTLLRPIPETIVEEVISNDLILEQKKGNTTEVETAPVPKLAPLKMRKEIQQAPQFDAVEETEVNDKAVLGAVMQDSSAEFDNSNEDKVELERVDTTGSHIRSDDLENADEFNQQLEILNSLIRKNKTAKAKRLLKKLQSLYPDFDFSDYLKKL